MKAYPALCCAFLLSLLVYLSSATVLNGQRVPRTKLKTEAQPSAFIVMSWNVENLFDCQNDPATEDDEFLPSSEKRWTPARYRRKLTQIANGISQIGEWQWPTLVAITEIENDRCAKDLLQYSPLGAMGYDYRISNGVDRRGIDVALLFLADRFRPIETREHFVNDPNESTFRTRPILHIAGRIETGDTLDVFICHFPSRRTGASATMGYRILAAQTARAAIDSTAIHRQNGAFILMGDFNADPIEESTSKYLGATSPDISHQTQPTTNPLESFCHVSAPQLINLFLGHSTFNPPGSYVYQGVWNQLDQIIVSASCLDGSVLSYIKGSARNVVLPGATKKANYSVGHITPLRTYAGSHYLGGISDHLPVTATFRLPNRTKNNLGNGTTSR